MKRWPGIGCRKVAGLGVGIVAFLLTMITSKASLAQATPTYTFWNRLTLDLGYELSYVDSIVVSSYYRSDASTGRESSALIHLRSRTLNHGIGLDSTFAVRPWLGIGWDIRVNRDFSAPSHDWFGDLGVSYGRRRVLGCGVLVEFRPFQRDFAHRRGLFFRAGVDFVARDLVVSREPGVEVSDNGHPNDLQAWFGGGYRLSVGKGLSLHASAEFAGSLDTKESRVRVGGGFQ